MLTNDVSDKAVFANMQKTGFKNDRSLKDHLVRVMLLKLDAEGRSTTYGEKKCSCVVCKSVNDTSHFTSRDVNTTFNILKGQLDCNLHHVIYLNVKM